MEDKGLSKWQSAALESHLRWGMGTVGEGKSEKILGF